MQDRLSLFIHITLEILPCPILYTLILLISDLPGIEVVGYTSVTVTNSAQSFCWSGYGFKLCTSSGSLPVNVCQCILHIYVSLAGQYQLPDGQELVSAIFWVKSDPPCRFEQKLTMEIQYCAKTTNLMFVRAVCSQKSLPYTFKKLEGRGSFSGQSYYGCLDISQFSGYGITANSTDVERLYIASLYYLKVDPYTIEIHFAITWDDASHITVSYI